MQREPRHGEEPWGGAGLGKALPLSEGSIHQYCLNPNKKELIRHFEDMTTYPKEVFNPFRDNVNEAPIQNMLCIPLWGEVVHPDDGTEGDMYDGLLGIIKLMNKTQNRQWTVADIEMASLAEGLISQQVAHVQQEQRLEQRLSN